MRDPAPFTIRDLISEAEREIALRRNVYPRWIERGRLTQAKADLHLALMRAIRDVLASLDRADAPAGEVEPSSRHAALEAIEQMRLTLTDEPARD